MFYRFALYGFLKNLRKPLTVALISDQVSENVVASTLSVKVQLTTLLSAAIAPLLGFLADQFGVGVALACFGIGMGIFSIIWRIRPPKAFTA